MPRGTLLRKGNLRKSAVPQVDGHLRKLIWLRIRNMKEQINREPYEFPIVNIKNKRENINDYIVDDFEILDYKHHDPIKMKMVA